MPQQNTLYLWEQQINIIGNELTSKINTAVQQN